MVDSFVWFFVGIDSATRGEHNDFRRQQRIFPEKKEIESKAETFYQKCCHAADKNDKIVPSCKLLEQDPVDMGTDGMQGAGLSLPSQDR